MCPNLSQPEEIDLVLKEIEHFDLQIDRQGTSTEPFVEATPKGRNTSNFSAYRAEYMKTHLLDL